jgi:hypothetical protein
LQIGAGGKNFNRPLAKGTFALLREKRKGKRGKGRKVPLPLLL